MTSQLLRENLRQCSPEQERMVAERVRSRVEQRIVLRLHCTVTVSIGAVRLPTRHQATASLQHADQTRHTAKSAGRNRVIWSELRLRSA